MADKVKVDVEVNASKAAAALTSIDDKLTGFTETVKEARETMAGWVGGLADFAVRIEQQERAIARLGSAYDTVLAATNGAISAQQAFTLRGQIQAAGIQVNDRALAALTRQAREWADVTGNDAAQAVEKLTNAIVNNSEDALAEMNLSMARGATGAQTLTNVVGELERRFAGTAPAARTLQQDIERLPAAFDAMGAAMLRSVEGPLARLFESMSSIAGVSVSMRQAVREIADAGDTLRAVDQQQQRASEDNARQTAREQLINRARTLGVRVTMQELRGLNVQQLSRLQQQLETAAGLQNNARGRTGDVNAAFASITNLGGASLLQEAFGGALGMIQQDAEREQRAAERRAGTTNNRILSEMEAGIERKQRKPEAAANSQAAQELERARTAYAEAVADGMERGAVIVTVDDMPRNARETLAAYFTRLAGLQRDFNSMGATNDLAPTNTAELEADRGKAEAAFAEQRAGTERDRERFQRISGRDRETRARALSQDRSFGGGVTRAFGLSSDAIRTEMELTDKYASTFVNAVGRMGEAFTRHVGLVVSGQESIGVAFLSVANEVSTSLAQQALPEAMMELARGFAALANPITAPTAPLHFTAAGVFGAVAAGAGVVALGSGAALSAMQAPPGAGAAATGAARAASGSSRGSLTQERAAPVTVVMSSLVPAGPADAQRARDGLRHARRQGFDDRLPRRVEF